MTAFPGLAAFCNDGHSWDSDPGCYLRDEERLKPPRGGVIFQSQIHELFASGNSIWFRGAFNDGHRRSDSIFEIWSIV